MDDAIKKWLKQAKDAGLSDEQISQKLQADGWDKDKISKLLRPQNNIAMEGQNQRQTLHSEKSTRWLKIAIITVIIIALEIAAYYFLSYIPKRQIVQDANLTECIREAGYLQVDTINCYRQYPSTQRSKEAICLADVEALPTESLDDNCKIFSQCLADAKALERESTQIACGGATDCLGLRDTENRNQILRRYYSDVDNCKNDFHN